MKSSDTIKTNEIMNINRNSFYILWLYHIFPHQKQEIITLSNELITSEVLLKLNMSLHLNNILGSQIVCFSYCNRKFSIIQYILNHSFLSPQQRDSFLDIFCAIEKIYLWLNRVAHSRKVKRANVAVDTDLYFNTLSTSKSNVFPLYQNNAIFYFTVSDLLNIIQCALCQEWEDNFMTKSRMPKNPYNKQALKKHDLYNLYYHMKYKMNSVIPLFFHLWFLDNFDLRKFISNNESILRKLCIRQFIKNVSNTNHMVAEDILDMIDEYKHICKWDIDDTFPKTVLVDCFRPYLYIHYLIIYNVLECSVVDEYETMLENELTKCYEQNPLFGRRKRIKNDISMEEQTTGEHPVFEWGKNLLSPHKQIVPDVPLPPSLYYTDCVYFPSWNY